jgi:hypothetical protein
MRRTTKLKLTEPIWERQVGESIFQYNTFLQFKEVKLAGGTMSTLQQKLGRKPAFVKQLQVLSCINCWTDRISAYLDHINNAELEEQEKARREMVKRQADNGVKFQTKAMEMLEKLVGNLDADDVCRLIETGVKMERIARGAPAEITAQAQTEKFETREERMERLRKSLDDVNE